MSNLSSRLRRLLFLVPYVARRGEGVKIDELARELDIDRQELLGDLDVLTQVGPPGGDPGEYLLVSVESGKVFVDLAQRLTRPLRLTAAEGCSLLLGLRALRRSGIAPYDRALASAEGKLLQALGADAPLAETLADGTVVAGENPQVAEHLRALLVAARARRAVQIEYSSASAASGHDAARGPSRGVESRGIEPYGIVHHAGAWYTIAGCRKHGDTRTFRVDRIARLKTLEEPFQPPGDFDLEAYRRERLYVPSADALRVTVRFDPIGAARVGSTWPAGEVRRLDGGGAEIDIDCEGLEWMVGWVLGFGRHARIIAPEVARSALRERLSQIKEQVRRA